MIVTIWKHDRNTIDNEKAVVMTERSDGSFFNLCIDRRQLLCNNYYIRSSTTDVVNLGGSDCLLSSDVMRGYNELMILSLLRKQDSYGYEISRQIKELSDEKYVMKETTLYSAFTRLERMSYIEAYYGEKTNGKRRTYYHITPEGDQFYREKCDEWELVKEIVNRFVSERKL